MSVRELAFNHDLYSLEAVLKNKSYRELTDGVERDPITKLRLLCLSQGATGILALGRAFRNMDTDRSKELNEKEFATGIQMSGLNVKEEEIKHMFECFNEDGSGSISMEDFLLKLRPPMAKSRLAIVNRVFNKMDRTGEGVISLDDFKKVYSVKEHPKYQCGQMTKDEIVDEFLDHFGGGRGNLDGSITKEEFENYYATISTTIDNDTYFDLLLRRVYAL